MKQILKPSFLLVFKQFHLDWAKFITNAIGGVEVIATDIGTDYLKIYF